MYKSVEELYPDDIVAQYENGPLTYFKVLEKSFFSLTSIYWNPTKIDNDDKLDDLEDKYENFTHADVTRTVIKRLPTTDLVFLTEKLHTNYSIFPILAGLNITYIYATYAIVRKFGLKAVGHFKIKQLNFRNLIKYS